MPRLKHRLPDLRHHRASGRAVVTLNGRDYYVGKWDTPEAASEYRRLIGEWLASGRGQPQRQEQPQETDPTVAEVILAFWRHAKTHYSGADGRPSQEVENVKEALRPLNRLYGHTPPEPSARWHCVRCGAR